MNKGDYILKVLEVNVDDIGHGGVYSFVINVMRHKKEKDLIMDFCAFEQFESQDHIKEIESLGGHVYYAGYSGNKLIKQIVCQKKLEMLVKENQYDVVHIHSDVANKLLGYAKACKKAGVNHIIVHSHSSGIDHGYRIFKEVLHRLAKVRLNGVAEVYAACSDYAAEWMYNSKLRKKSKIIIINNGIDIEKFKYDIKIRNKWRNELELDGKVVLGHVGRFDYQKNHAYLIDVFSAIEKRRQNVVLLLIGEGEGKKDIEEKVKKLGLSDKVMFLGVTNKVHELLQAMDLFLLPSHFEGLPISGVEAQAAGLPVIFSNKITREAQLTSNVRFASIEGTPEEWADYAEELIQCERKDTSQELVNKGFDNMTSIRKLESIYYKLCTSEIRR